MKKKESRFAPEALTKEFVHPNGLRPAEKAKADAAVLLFRKQQLANQTSEELLFSQLMQLRIRLEMYLDSPDFDSRTSFSYFLAAYLRVLRIRKKDFADDISIHETRLSQLLSEKVEPNEKLMLRLEIHSNNLFPALYWMRLQEKKRMHELTLNKQLRKQEARFVKKRAPLNTF